MANNIVNGSNPVGGGGAGDGAGDGPATGVGVGVGDVGEAAGALAGVVNGCRRPLSHNLSGGKKMANTGDLWLQWFSCCFQHRSGAAMGGGGGGGGGGGKASSRHHRSHQRLRRIDRSMIGNPTNFVHTAHIGSGDVEMSSNHLNALQVQMQSKGGYEMNSIQLQVKQHIYHLSTHPPPQNVFTFTINLNMFASVILGLLIIEKEREPFKGIELQTPKPLPERERE